ncbi:unnamed protein product, partial [Protopolystoma xenopodis]
MVGNFLVILTLLRRRYQSVFSTIFFIHQTMIDFVVCLLCITVVPRRKDALLSRSGNLDNYRIAATSSTNVTVASTKERIQLSNNTTNLASIPRSGNYSVGLLSLAHGSADQKVNLSLDTDRKFDWYTVEASSITQVIGASGYWSNLAEVLRCH